MKMEFDAVSELAPGPKWRRRWQRSWPAYMDWFVARGGDGGPDRQTCRAALGRHMPAIVPVYDRLVHLAGGGDRAARFLAAWCPPRYLGGCSLAAMSDATDVRLLRNYDLSPDLNEGLLLRSEWTGRPVMGMVEFLWGLSDGINDAGLAVALAYGGRSETAEGFGIPLILRYVLEVCRNVPEALRVLDRVPSHMGYNVVLADAAGATASVELSPGGGARQMPYAVATNHQSGARPDRASFTRTYERHRHLRELSGNARGLHTAFTRAPLRQERFAEGFGTLFTCEYDPAARSLRLLWPSESWCQGIDRFNEGRRVIDFASASSPAHAIRSRNSELEWARAANMDWFAIARAYARGEGRPIEDYIVEASQLNLRAAAVARPPASRPRQHGGG